MNVRPSRGCCLVCGFVGGWLLGCRESAKSVFQKSELASCSRSDSGLLKNNADFRQPRISSPPAEADQTASPARAVRFKAVGLGWLGGSWMSRQRCAGRRGGKAEFPCGLMGRGWAEVLRCRLGVCRGASLSAGSVSNCGGIFGWVLRDFFFWCMVWLVYLIRSFVCMDILGASGSEAFSIFCYCEGSENPFYGVFIQCVVKPLASAMGI